MRGLKKNKTTFWYALYQGKEPLYEEGLRTGEEDIKYSEWKQYSANISPATGQAVVEQFGNSEQYDKIIVTADIDCEIDENTILCLGIDPFEHQNIINESGLPFLAMINRRLYPIKFAGDNEEERSMTYDYIVKKKAKSLNSISYAISKVKIND